MKERELTEKEARTKVEKLLSTVDTVYLATNGSHGHPNIRPMMPVKIDGVEKIWFCTDLESSKIIELIKDSKAAISGHSPKSMAEFRLWGSMHILDDAASRQYVWNEELESQYTGEDDPTMRVLRFDVISGMYNNKGKSGIFTI